MTNLQTTLYDRTITFYEPPNHPHQSHAVVFIHGGAWIDKRNTPHDFEHLCKIILDKSEGRARYAMYGIEYRLSPEVKHPTHLCDVIENLYELIKEKGLTQIHLLGHSVGATLAWQVCSCDSAIYPTEAHLQLVKSCLRGIYLVDGIFSISELLDEYPEYLYFVAKAFENHSEDFEEFNNSINRLSPSITEIHLLHSYKDELLSLRQPLYMTALMQQEKIPFHSYFSDMGSHNEVYQSSKLADYLLVNLRFT